MYKVVNIKNLREYKDKIDPKNNCTITELNAIFNNKQLNDDEKFIQFDKLLGNHGIESVLLENNKLVEYSNTGDIFTMTIIKFNDKLRFASWFDVAENFGVKDVNPN